MQADSYMKDRVDSQIQWYSGKSSRNKKLYVWTNGGIIFFSALIPFVSGMDSAQPLPLIGMHSNVLAGLLGVLTGTLTGLSALMKYQEKWTIYRSACEALEREKLLFKTQTAPYQSEAGAFHLFVQNVERILSTEGNAWNAAVSVGGNNGEEGG